MPAAVKERLKSADDSFDINKRFTEKLRYEFTVVGYFGFAL
jgi:hypothetical protein